MAKDEVEILEPAFKNNDVAIAMSSSNEYVPYLSVCLQSIVNSASLQTNYDIIIFERSITDENKNILKKQILRENISLRFVNPQPLISQYNLKFPPEYNLECYFRLTSPLVLKNYKKIIFTDVDLVFRKDIAQLYNIPLDKAIAACQDLVYCAFIDTPSMDIKLYAQSELELKDPYKYFNTGVLLINIEYFQKNDLSKILLKMANEKMYRILEQDILNKYFKDNIYYLDDRWNFPTMNPLYLKLMKNTKPQYQKRYHDARIDPYIIHWAGKGKAWLNPSEDLAHIWWNYARQTPFYEELLQRISLSYFSKNEKELRLLFVIEHMIFFTFQKIKYKIKKAFLFGKHYEKYNTKYKTVKQLIKEAKKYRKTLCKIL